MARRLLRLPEPDLGQISLAEVEAGAMRTGSVRDVVGAALTYVSGLKKFVLDRFPQTTPVERKFLAAALDQVEALNRQLRLGWMEADERCVSASVLLESRRLQAPSAGHRDLVDALVNWNARTCACSLLDDKPEACTVPSAREDPARVSPLRHLEEPRDDVKGICDDADLLAELAAFHPKTMAAARAALVRLKRMRQDVDKVNDAAVAWLAPGGPWRRQTTSPLEGPWQWLVRVGPGEEAGRNWSNVAQRLQVVERLKTGIVSI